jgi:uncharacterized protein YdcH (DUF465 family)
MLSESHDFAHEHPEHKDKIHDMKMNNNHFARLYDEYHDVNKEILRIEKEIEACSDEHLEDLKKKRLQLSDELTQMLAA